MAQILETVMLICFGVSWPISVYKNYKARTAVGTSVAFILMIMVGYVAGITAKIISGSASYVLVVYFLNLLMVGLNLLVYFRNRNLDKREEGGLVRHEAVTA